MENFKNKKTIQSQRVLSYYWKDVRKIRGLLLLTIVCAVASNTIAVIIPTFTKRFFDLLSGVPSLEKVSSILGVLISIFMLRLTSWSFNRIGGPAVVRFETQVMSRLRMTAFDYLLQHSHTFFVNSFSGSLTQKVNKFARSFETMFDQVYQQIIPTIISIFGSLYVVSKYSTNIVYIFIGAIACFIIYNFFFVRYKSKFDFLASEADTKTSAVIADSISNQSTIQLFSAFTFEHSRVFAVVDDLRKKKLKQWNTGEIAYAVQSFIMIFAEYLILRYSVIQWRAGLLSVGTIIMFQVYILALMNRLFDFSHVFRRINESISEAKEMVSILDTPHEIRDIQNAGVLKITDGLIVCNNVTFKYHDNNVIINKINLEILPGEKIAIIGSSGAGKSTFVKLLLRLHDVTSGQITIDGQNIAGVTQDSLHDGIAFVPQDPVLFHRTLMENIRYGRRDATDAEVREAARLAHCAEFIENLPSGYDTLVGERGIKLSGGERQRVAIARAILKNAPILVLDEATSSLDSHSEGLIQDALEELMKGKTVIVIAHRLSTIRKMDRILVLDGGEIIEQGTHTQLLRKKESMYKKLWELQAGGFIKDEK